MQPVGELDEEHPQVFAHRQEELAQVLRRALVVGQLLELGELGHAVHQPGNVGAELRLDILDRRQRILDRIMQQRGDHRVLIELEVGHQAGDLDRMAEVWIAAGTLLGAVLLHGVDVGAVEQRLVGIGLVGLDPLD